MFNVLICALAFQAVPAADAITRTALKSTATMEAARIAFAPGAVEPPENHGYDVVIVPLEEGMTAELEGQTVSWTTGIPILVSRGAPHRLANRSDHLVRFIEVRTIGDNPAGTDEVIRSSRATIVRSVVGKYVRATVWRYEPTAHVEWPQTVDALTIFAIGEGGVVVERSTDSVAEHEVVRVSRMASR